MLDLIIRNGWIVDGTGEKKAWRGEVGVKDGKIAAVAEHIDDDAAQVLDAKGHIIAPGFLDVHRHTDVVVLHEDYGEIELRQGITTVVGGQCGLSIVPCPDQYKEEMFRFLQPIVGTISTDCGFSTFEEYINKVREHGVRLNYGCCIGNGASRMAAKGFESDFNEDDIKRVQGLIRESLAAGALGVTTGIVYAPECQYSLDEFVEVLQPMKEFGVPLVTHIRGEGDTLQSSLREVVEIAERVGVPLHISHFKNVGKQNWGHNLDGAFKILYDARDRGMDVTWDCYPYTAGATQMIQYLPPDYLEGGLEETTRRLADPEKRAKLKEILAHHQDYFENMLLASGWDKTIITSVTKPENEKYIGLTVTELAEKLGKDPYDAAFDLLVDEHCFVGMVNFTASEEDNRRIVKDKYTNIISDTLCNDGGLPHPRVYGSFPRVLETFVREEGILTVEEAVMKMTSVAARVYGLNTKGVLAEGMDADIVVFDKDTVGTKATYTDSKQLATGYDYVIVNGAVTVKDDCLLPDVKNGTVLLHKR